MDKTTKETLHKCLLVACTQGKYEWMKTPFNAYRWNAATDGHILVGWKGDQQYPALKLKQTPLRISEWMVGRSYGGDDLVPNEGTIKAEDVLKAMDLWPRVMEKDCEGPDGSGCLLDDDEDCETCKGDGVIVAPEGSKGYPDPMQRVHVEGVGYFMHLTWEKLSEIITILGCKVLTVTYGSERTMMRLLPENHRLIICMMPATFRYPPHEPPFFVINK